MDTFQGISAMSLYLLPIFAFGAGVYFVRRFVIALERRASSNGELNELRARVAELEEAREVTDREVLRLQAANEFAVQLLAGRVQDASIRLRQE